ncbi:DUF6197 family protein [Micromonospora tulbaghiae]|uniref:DUF6197 family protein n=1 Tax=Micromonospora tulbaghiae TaxID=479978 RepID=UPI0013C50E9A|nr:hypothetical protein [Micromonospora tulbaghiae]
MSDTVTVLPPDTPAADILTAAADVIAQRGKCEGAYTDRQGRVCALGALRLVLTGEAEPRPFAPGDRGRQVAYIDAFTALGRHLEAVDANAPAIYEWSDASTQDQVVAAMRAAADRARVTR